MSKTNSGNAVALKRFPAELAYLLGIVILAAGAAIMTRADLGMSMVVAPAYIIYLKLSETITWFTFGMAEYCLQAVLILALSLVLKKFRVHYLFSFLTALFYGFVLDGAMALAQYISAETMAVRIPLFIAGMLLGSVGVSLLFHTYIAPEAYELVVKEVSLNFDKDIHKVKTVYDCISCGASIILSFLFFGFGHFEGVKAGTVIAALLNGFLISKVSAFLNSRYEFYDAFRK